MSNCASTLRYGLTACLLLLIVFSCQQPARVSKIQKVQRFADSIAQADSLPGISIAYMFSDQTPQTIVSGFADTEDQLPMESGMLLLSGSIGKTYVAALVLRFYELGLINLNKPVKEYLLDEKWYDSLPNAATITPVHLLQHTSGLERYEFKKAVWDSISLRPEKEWTVAERMTLLVHDAPLNAAGEAFSYSDANYILLGALLERISGRDYYALVADSILQPMHLHETMPSDRQEITGLVSAYTAFSGQFQIPVKVADNQKLCFNPQMEWTGGGMANTPSDLCRWAQKLYGGKYLSDSTLNLMIHPATFETGISDSASYGMGCIIWKPGTTEVSYGHTGFFPGFRSIIRYYPQHKLAIAFQTNTDKLPPEASLAKYTGHIKQLILDEIPL
jgi:D-alanyl-D-alanine carboxypeptidase